MRMAKITEPNIPVKLHGGPKDGETIKYYSPLPKILVITEVSEANSVNAKLKYHNYKRVGKRDYNYVEGE
jgi:hypothetical protein